MSLNRFQVMVIAGWFTSLILVIAILFAAGIPTLPQSAALFGLGCIPVVILLAVFRGAPPRTIAQVLYDTDRTAVGLARARLHRDQSSETDLL